MKLAQLALISVTLLLPQTHAQGSGNSTPTKVSVVAIDGVDAKLSEDKEQSVKFWLQQLVLSALYRGMVLESSLDEWQKVSTVLPRIQCVYSLDTRIAIPEEPTLEFEQILFPLNGGGYSGFIYLRKGDRVQRIAKYDPWVLQKLKVESGMMSADKLTAPRTLF